MLRNKIKYNLSFILISILFLTVSCSNQGSGYWKKNVSKSSSWEYLLSESENIENLKPSESWQKLTEADFDKIKEILFQENSSKNLYLKAKFQLDNTQNIIEGLFQTTFNLNYVGYFNNLEIAKIEKGQIRNNLSPKEISENKVGVFDLYAKQNFFIDKEILKNACINGENTIMIKVLNKDKATIKFNEIYFFTQISSETPILAIDNPTFIPSEYFINSNLPIITINTNNAIILDEPKIVAEMGVINNSNNNNNLITDKFNDYDGKIAIEIRGATSQSFAKKSYGFKTIDKKEKKQNVSLLGLPEDNDWILYGPYADRALIRNSFTYKLGKEMGLLAVKTQFCELVINGDYRGVYVLMQKIKINTEMVNISQLAPNDTSEKSISGGYLIKIDKGAGEFWASPFPKEPELAKKYFFKYVEPIAQDMPEKQKLFIKNYIIEFENALYNNKFNEIEKYIDLQSFVDYFIINEFTKNIDSYRLSTYMYKNRDEKLKMGPIWDYNFSLGLTNYNDGFITEGWVYNSSIYIPFWWKKLMEYPKFKKLLIERWKIYRQNTLSLDNIYSIIDNEVSQIEIPNKRNTIKWKIEGGEIWPNQFNGKKHIEDVEYMKNWIKLRLEWLDDNIK